MRAEDFQHDSTIAARVRARDSEAFTAMVRAHYDVLFGYAASLLHGTTDADDVLQTVLLRVWANAESFAPAGSLRVYLLSAVRNGVIAHRQRSDALARRDARVVADDAPSDDIVASLERDEFERAVHDAVLRLPERCREIWQLSREQGLSHAEIAAVTGVSVNTVKTQIGRAITAIRVAAAPFLVLLLATR